jgi:hypothetical protein
MIIVHSGGEIPDDKFNNLDTPTMLAEAIK